MPSFVNEINKVNRVAVYFVVDVEWEGLGTPAREPVWPNVVASTPFDNFTDLPGDAFSQRTCETRRNICVTLFRAQ